jgi:hypothetical protein
LNIQAEKEYPFDTAKRAAPLAVSAARMDGERAFLRD